MNIAQEIADIVVQDPDGKDVRLGSMWDGRSVVLVFVRHFG
jgi:hypothetical protein